MRCETLTDPKQGRRLKILDFSSSETESKNFFPFSKEEVRNEEGVVEYSQSSFKRIVNRLCPISQKCSSKPTKKCF